MAQIPIRMPKMSMTMTEGEVSEWFVQAGDSVTEGDVICEVLTDKVDMEVESPATGLISSIAVASGSVDVGFPIGYIEGDAAAGLGDLLDGIGDAAAVPGEQAPGAAERPPDPAPEPEPTSTAPVAAVPRARGLARDHGIDVRGLQGSGKAGLVLVADVERVIATAASVPVSAPSPANAPAASTAAANPPSRQRTAQVRARVAAKMTESAGVPQFTLWRDLALDATSQSRCGVSWTTVLLRAFAGALREVPELLCRWEDGAALASGPPRIGLAVDSSHGLLAPVLVAPDDEDPQALDERVRAVVAAAQSGRVDAAYLQPANATISNLGGLGVDRFQALVTPPQASVLSVGSIRPRPIAVQGGVGTALIVTVGLSVDHRVADGAHGARLLAALDDILRHWGESGPGG